MLQQAVVGANGEAAVIAFSDEVRTVQDFTSSGDAISDTFRNLKPADTDQGRMVDAVARALDMLANRPTGARSVILVIGESKDRGSESKIKDLLPRIQRSAVTIYSLRIRPISRPSRRKPASTLRQIVVA